MNLTTFKLLVNEINKVVFDSFKDLDMVLEMELQKDLYLDSISFYTLIVNLEQLFKIRFKKVSMDASEFKTIESLANYIDQLREEDVVEE